MLTKSDLSAIGKLMDSKLDGKLKSINEFIKFAKPALIALLDESQDNFKQHLPERVKHLEDIHPHLHRHTS